MYQNKIYVDVDDVIFNTSELVIQLLNKYYNITPPKTVNDLKDWGFKSIYRDIDYKIIYDFWDSDEFFEQVKINEDFIDFYKKTKDDVFYWVFLTQGTEQNLKKKKELLQKYFSKFDFIGVPTNAKKKNLDLSDGIQIDDNYDNLLSNAYFKILIKNFHETDYNQVLNNHTNLYIVNEWKEIIDILNFYNSIEVKDLI